jgi:hypothetical protein
MVSFITGSMNTLPFFMISPNNFKILIERFTRDKIGLPRLGMSKDIIPA